MKKERFQTLDGWRGVCALLVALFHLNAYSHFYEMPFFQNSWLFVDFFFVLSGFVISHAYMGRLGGWLETRSFIIRRFGRLFPLHAAVLVALIGLELTKLILLKFGGFSAGHPAFSNRETVDAIITNMFLIHSLGVHDTLTWNTPSWSISTEFYTYIVFAGVFSLTRKSLPSFALSLVIALISAGIVFRFSTKGMDTTYDYGFFRCLYGFFIGHLTYRLWKSGSGRQFDQEWWLVEITSVVLVVFFVSLVGRTVWSLAAPFVFGFVVWVFAYERGPVSRLMNVQPMALLGAWSYSLYMVHDLVLKILEMGASFIKKTTGLLLRIEMSFPWQEKVPSRSWLEMRVA